MFLQSKAVSRICLAAAFAWSTAGAAVAGPRLQGPYTGLVERVVDGDTLAVRVTVWLQQDVWVLVRLRGVDAPETHGECASEKAGAAAATAELTRLVSGGAVQLKMVEGDKYYGRVLADVLTPEGTDVAQTLLAGGFVRAYVGGRRGGWCELGLSELAGEGSLTHRTPH
jgi:micrococcal nuclease